MSNAVTKVKLQGMVSRGINKVWIDELGNLIIEMTDGSIINLGNVVGTGSIYHHWEGTVLYVRSASGTSSADLRGPAGEFGKMTDEEKSELAEEVLRFIETSKLVVVQFYRQDGLWLASKTIDELKDAVMKNYMVACEYAEDNRYYRGQLIGHSEESFAFVIPLPETDLYFSMSADGDIECRTFNNEDTDLLVTVTKGTDGSYAADTSFADIETAIAGDVQPSVKLVGANGESYGQLVSYAAGRMVQFSAWLHGGTVDASTVVTVDADDEVYVTYPTEPRVVGVSARKDGSTVTVTVSYEDLSSEEVVIGLNEDGDPVSVTRDGAVCTLTWEGFDE